MGDDLGSGAKALLEGVQVGLDAADHLDILIHKGLVLLVALGQAVDQCTQLTLCPGKLGLLRDDLCLRSAALCQIHGGIAALFRIFQTHFLDLIEIHNDTSLTGIGPVCAVR